MAGGFTTSGTLCGCVTGKYLTASNTCEDCTTIFEFCTACTIGSCTVCAPPSVLSSGHCICPVGYYHSSVLCETCQSQFLGCIQCTLGSCTTCDTAQLFALSGTSCACSSGSTLTGTTCTLCSTLMTGCVTCDSPGVCDTCNTASHYVFDSGTCQCAVGYYKDAAGICQTCGSAIAGCTACDNNSTCTACDTANLYVLNGTVCGCATDYALVGGVCVDCHIPCECPGHVWADATNTTCVAVCGDGLTYAPEQCDDSNVISGDGCSSTCG